MVSNPVKKNFNAQRKTPIHDLSSDDEKVVTSIKQTYRGINVVNVPSQAPPHTIFHHEIFDWKSDHEFPVAGQEQGPKETCITPNPSFATSAASPTKHKKLQVIEVSSDEDLPSLIVKKVARGVAVGATSVVPPALAPASSTKKRTSSHVIDLSSDEEVPPIKQTKVVTPGGAVVGAPAPVPASNTVSTTSLPSLTFGKKRKRNVETPGPVSSKKVSRSKQVSIDNYLDAWKLLEQKQEVEKQRFISLETKSPKEIIKDEVVAGNQDPVLDATLDLVQASLATLKTIRTYPLQVGLGNLPRLKLPLVTKSRHSDILPDFLVTPLPPSGKTVNVTLYARHLMFQRSHLDGILRKIQLARFPTKVPWVDLMEAASKRPLNPKIDRSESADTVILDWTCKKRLNNVDFKDFVGFHYIGLTTRDAVTRAREDYLERSTRFYSRVVDIIGSIVPSDEAFVGISLLATTPLVVPNQGDPSCKNVNVFDNLVSRF